MKQVIVLRKDLNMRKGKMVAQGAHASLLAFFMAKPEYQEKWLESDYIKICVGVDSEQELRDLCSKAGMEGVTYALVKDLGLTEFKEPTFTGMGIGPAPDELINLVTGHLKLL